MTSTERPVCAWCGTTAPETAPETAPGAVPEATLPLTWVTSLENGRNRVYCDRCAREHVRAIEGKLDSEWW